MDRLLAQAKAGTLIAPNVPMGWQYYTRKGLAAILIAALLAGIAMPERVMAGYRWLVEVIEQFFKDRTEYIYTSNADEDIEFVPMQFGYLPEGMKLNIKANEAEFYEVLFTKVSNDSNYYFEIEQKLLNSKRVYGSNTEVYYTELININDEFIKLYERENILYFSWLHDKYHIYGQTNLQRNELIKILENIKSY